MHFDIFISYASEDNDFVRPLANALRDCGYGLWYDEFVLRVGDSLTERIDYGLANSTAGIFVISPAFMSKSWPRRELAGFSARHIAEAARLIPLWLNVNLQDVLRFSPPLADIKALQSSEGTSAIVRMLKQVVSPTQPAREDDTIESAREMLARKDYDLAARTAYVAFDRRLFALIDRAMKDGALPAASEEELHFDPLWDAVGKLRKIGRLTVPSSVNLDLLRHLTHQTPSPYFGHPPPPTAAEAEAIVSQIATLMRENPRP